MRTEAARSGEAGEKVVERIRYAAESPAEFFAVLSEVFFADPTLLVQEYPKVYELFAWFYKQDPASRTELLLET